MPSSLHATMESLRHDVILHQDALPHHRDHVKHQVHDVLFVPPKYQISNMNIHPLTSSYHQCIVFLIFFESLFLGGFGHAVTRDAALPDPPATAFTNTAQASEAVAGYLHWSIAIVEKTRISIQPLSHPLEEAATLFPIKETSHSRAYKFTPHLLSASSTKSKP